MTRNEFKTMVAAGTVTPEQARVLTVEIIDGLLRRVETGAAADLTPTLALAHPQKGVITRVEAETRFAGQLVEAGGLGFFQRAKSNYQVVLHWPSIFKAGLSHPKMLQTRIAWLFQSIIRRRSPLLFSLLRRKLITESATFDLDVDKTDGVFDEDALKKIVPVNQDELELFESLTYQLGQVKNLGEVAGRALVNLFASAGLETRNLYHVLRVWKDVLPPVPTGISLLQASTLVSRRTLVLFREMLHAGRAVSPPDITIDVYGFSTPKYSPEIFDVLAVPHLATTDGRFGVCRRVQPGERDDIKYMLLNLPMVVQQLQREDHFTWAGKQANTLALKHPANHFIDQLKSAWAAQYPLLMAQSGEGFDYQRTWPTAEFGDVYAVPVTAFEHYRQVARKMENVRKAMVKKGRMPPKVRRPAVHSIVQLLLGPIEEAGGATFSVRAAFRRGEAIFSPAWEVDFDQSFFQARNYVQATGLLHDGIIINESTGEYYYTLARYFTFAGTPVSQYSELKSKLKGFLSSITKNEFRYMHRALKDNPTREGFVPYSAKKKSAKEIKFFTEAEDREIINHLRPGNISDAVVRVQEVDPLKTRSDLIHRAYSLREQLIADGVYDLEKLPHVNYSASLGKRLRDLKDAKEREQREKDKPASQGHDL